MAKYKGHARSKMIELQVFNGLCCRMAADMERRLEATRLKEVAIVLPIPVVDEDNTRDAWAPQHLLVGVVRYHTVRTVFMSHTPDGENPTEAWARSKFGVCKAIIVA